MRLDWIGRGGIAAAGVAALLVLTACSSSGGGSAAGTGSTASGASDSASGSAGLQAAENDLDKWRAPLTFKAPGPAFDASVAKGKKVYVIATDLTIPWDQATVGAIKTALKPFGVDLTVADAQSKVDEVNKDIQTAINEKVDLLSVISFPPDSIAAPLQAAKAAGIPVITQGAVGNPGPVPAKFKNDYGILANVDYSQTEIGTLMGEWAAAETKASAHVVAYGSLNDPGGALQETAEKAALQKVCPDSCSFKNYSFQNFSDFFNQLPTQAASDLQDNSINVMMPDYDTYTQPIIPVIEQKGVQDKVSLISSNGTPEVLASALGKGPFKGDIGSPYSYIGWALADEYLRVISGQPAVEDAPVPMRVFDSSNIPSIDFSKGDVEVYGFDPAVEFPKLWSKE